MKNIIIKVVVPLMVLVGIITFIISTQKPIEELSSELNIKPFDFKNYVDNYISDSISGKQIKEAQARYNQLYAIITTEASITIRTDSTGNSSLLDPQSAEEYYAKAFSSYFDIFRHDADKMFTNSTWDKNSRDFIKEEAKRMLTLQGTAVRKDSLEHYISYINGYDNAIKLIANAKYCSGKSGYDHYTMQAAEYKGYPYKNNSQLANILTDVKQNALDGWKKTLETITDELCKTSNYKFDSYDDFNKLYRAVYDRINEYPNTPAWTKKLKNQLEEKDIQVKEYFKSKDNQSTLSNEGERL